MINWLIDIDNDLLAAAQRAVGQDTIKGTVIEAHYRLVAQQRCSEEHFRAPFEPTRRGLVGARERRGLKHA